MPYCCCMAREQLLRVAVLYYGTVFGTAQPLPHANCVPLGQFPVSIKISENIHATATLPSALPSHWLCLICLRQARCLSSQAALNVQGGAERGERRTGRKARTARRTEEEQQKVAAHKAEVLGYKKKMTALRKEVQEEVLMDYCRMLYDRLKHTPRGVAYGVHVWLFHCIASCG